MWLELPFSLENRISRSSSSSNSYICNGLISLRAPSISAVSGESSGSLSVRYGILVFAGVELIEFSVVWVTSRIGDGILDLLGEGKTIEIDGDSFARWSVEIFLP
ncbi:hypothetical protein AVEN_85972-1 [Araneus ventricosus]|uniref:Uncharacterized protein n=1 Tax=Araneus ventricosus TaxID=182803 RepID=A0A4Y2PIZ7_ARAVE|nr:hypothetical protein AVEN_85972-1 [Araneus ventricosus]